MPGDTESEEREFGAWWGREWVQFAGMHMTEQDCARDAWLERARRARAEAEGLQAACRAVLRRWTFDDNQQHTHSWHDMQDCAELIRAALARKNIKDQQ